MHENHLFDLCFSLAGEGTMSSPTPTLSLPGPIFFSDDEEEEEEEKGDEHDSSLDLTVERGEMTMTNVSPHRFQRNSSPRTLRSLKKTLMTNGISNPSSFILSASTCLTASPWFVVHIELIRPCFPFSYHIETTTFSIDLQFIFEFVERSSSGSADANGEIR